MRSKKTLVFGLIIALCSLTACTKTKLAYGFLDNWLRWQMQSYFDPTTAQKQHLKTLTKVFHQWHRQNELDTLADFAQQTASLLDQPTITTEQIKDHMEQMQAIYQRSAEQLRHIANAILPTLNDDQIAQILHQLNKETQEYQEQYLAVTHQQRIADRAETLSDFFSGNLGKLTLAQQELIKDWSRGVDNLAAEGLLQLLFWREQFEQYLRADLTDAANLAALGDLLFNESAPLNSQHEQRETANRESLRELIVALHQSLTAKQRAHVQKSLARYQQDFIELAEQ